METKTVLKLVPGKSRVRITNVDVFGFCGRDQAPTQQDVGRMCTVEEITVDDFNAPDEPEYAIVMAVPDGQPWRRLQLIDTEVEESC
jgi:hypothetical protein